ncbi:MAG TPA: XRE family transcriptional regulator [Bacillota bacterium]
MDLGSRLKKMRLNQLLSVRDLAAKVGVSPSFIYQLEQGRVSPSFSTLKAMAMALGTRVSVLTDDNLPEDWLVVRRDRRKRLVTSSEGVNVELLTFLGSRDKRMQPVILTLGPGAVYDENLNVHDHEDFLLVLDGRVEVTLGDRALELAVGDAGYFLFQRPTSLRNPGETEARVLWTISPPTF